MNQEKIGKFISEKRKSKNITQSELAEKLGVTNRAVSNWENGKNMPDLSLFKPLCNLLEISINELMSGEEVSLNKYNEKLEENIINTIDYVDKKKNKNNDAKNFILLILGVAGVILSQLFNINDNENYVMVISMILLIYGLKQLSIKYKLVRRIMAIILLLICLIIIKINV